ncbi:MAG: VWA domain-containing protein [Planctomycetota bacterium]|nr:VWA domain-containing protein [Planctomycetota bacterium]
MDFRFQHLEALHWLWVVGAMLVLVIAGFQLRRRARDRLADASLHDRLMPQAGRGRRVLRAVLVIAAGVMLVIAALDVRWGVSYEPVRQRGIDIMIVLDTSRSMLAEDVRPNRLERARQCIGDLVSRLAGDRVGLVTFAGHAALRCPLTVDYGAFLLSLETVTTESAGRGGSLLGDALRLAGDSFTDDLPEYKAIIVFTDGEDHGSYPLEAARKLAEARSLPIYTVGIGDRDEGARIPTEVDGQRVYLKYQGEEVWSKLDSSLLRDIALAAGGAYVPVGTGTVDMDRVWKDRIEPAAKREFESTFVKRYTARYQWFAGLALLLLLVESCMGDRRPLRRRRPMEAAS